MNVCGISAHFHDAAAALVVDGKLVAAAQEERFSRHKGDPALPARAFEFCLDHAGLAPDELDAVVFYEKPFRKFYRVVATILANAPHGYRAFRTALSSWFERKIWVAGSLARTLGVPREKVRFSDHHLSHAAAVFLTHPLPSAAALVADGVGEWATTTIGRLERRGGGFAWEVVDTVDFPHSLGLLYSALTAFLGFRVNEGEYKVMGLAAYGRPRLRDELRRLVREGDDGLFRLDLSYFAHDLSIEKGWTRRLEDLLGPPNPPFRPLQHHAPDFQHYADVAASLQVVLEEELLRLAQRTRERTGERVLCYGGGVALNCVANGKLARSGIFDRVLVHPASGDAGGAAGAALAWSASRGVLAPAPRSDARLGVDVSGTAPLVRDGENGWTRTSDEAEFIERVAHELVEDRVVGWMDGRAEWGPRALGGRSILARPDVPGQVERLNRLVKEREGFRPFAPIVLAEHADELFEGFSPGKELERFMLGTVTTRPAWRGRLAAVTHVDGSSRVQVLQERDSPLLHRVLTAFHARTGLPALVNTSFNHASEPIVNGLADGLASFERCGLDVLAVYPSLLTTSSMKPQHA